MKCFRTLQYGPACSVIPCIITGRYCIVYLLVASLLAVATAAVFIAIQLLTVKRDGSRRIDPEVGESTLFEAPLNIYRSTHREMPDYLNIHTESSFFAAHYRDPIWGFVVFWHSDIAELFAVLSKCDWQRRTDLHFMYRYCCCACSNPLQDNL